MTTRSIRQDVVKYLTDRVGQVVYRADISADTGWDERQVRDAIRRVQDESAIGDEIESVIRGTAWRYLPHTTVVVEETDDVNARPTGAKSNLPLTTLIRGYLLDHPHQVVSVSDLVEYTGRTEYQVKVGVNNMRRITSNGDITSNLEVVAAGRLWRFNPPPGWRPGQRSNQSPTSPLPSSPTTATPTVQPIVDARQSPNGQVAVIEEPTGGTTRVFEEVGQLRDGRLVISDQDGNMYAATPMQSQSS